MSINRTYVANIIFILTFSYLAYINFNLPFLVMDELTGTIKSTFYQFAENLQTGRISHMFALLTNGFLAFKAPVFIELVPRYISIIILFITLYFYIKHISNTNSLLTLLFVSFIIITNQIDWQHCGMIAFYGSYNIYLSSFLGSLIIYESKYKVNKNIFIYCTIMFLLLISYASELFFGLSIVYLAMSQYQNFRIKKLISNPIFVSILIYIISFIITRPFLSEGPSTRMTTYIVGSLADFSLYDILSGTLLYFINSIPYYNELDFDKNMSLLVSIVILFIFGLITRISLFREFLKSTKSSHILLLFIIMLLPQFLISLQPMKLHWILNDMSTRYAFSSYTWISMVLIFVIALDKIEISKIIKYAISCLSFLYMIYAGYMNIKFVGYYEQSLKNWKEIHKLFDTNDKVIYMNSELINGHPFISPVSSEYIKKYGKDLFGKEVLICSEYGKLDFSNTIPDGINLINFYDAEQNGRWTNGIVSKIEYTGFQFKKDMAFKFEFSNVIGLNSSKDIKFRIGEDEFSRTLGDNKELVYILNKDSDQGIIQIDIPHPIQPVKLGINSDTRQLGLMIKRIIIGKVIDDIFIPNKQKVCK